MWPLLEAVLHEFLLVRAGLDQQQGADDAEGFQQVVDVQLARTADHVRLLQTLQQLKITYRQNAGNDVQCSDKYGKVSCVKHCMCPKPVIHKRFNLLIGSDWPKWHSRALLRYVIYSFLSDQMSFHMVQQVGCQNVNECHNMHWLLSNEGQGYLAGLEWCRELCAGCVCLSH